MLILEEITRYKVHFNLPKKKKNCIWFCKLNNIILKHFYVFMSLSRIFLYLQHLCEKYKRLYCTFFIEHIIQSLPFLFLLVYLFPVHLFNLISFINLISISVGMVCAYGKYHTVSACSLDTPSNAVVCFCCSFFFFIYKTLYVIT